MNHVAIYITYPDLGTATAISQALLDARLVACANIEECKSLYHWQGKIEEATEARVIYKTAKPHFAAIEALVKAQHPYDVPCIIALDITASHAPYLDWITTETTIK